MSGKQKCMCKKLVSINNNEITQKNDKKQVKKSIQANKKNSGTNCGEDLSRKANVNKIPGTFLGFVFCSVLVSIRKTEAFVHAHLTSS